MKILKDIFWLGCAAFAGYVLYKIYQRVSAASQSAQNAAGSVASTAAAWTPGAIGSNIGATIAADAAKMVSAVTDLFGGGSDVTASVDSQFTASKDPVYQNLVADMPVNYDPSLFSWSNPFQSPVASGGDFAPGGGSARPGSGTGGGW